MTLKICLNGCKLDKESVKHICNDIYILPDILHTTGKITIGIDKSLENDPQVQQYIETIKGRRWRPTIEWN